MHAVCIGIDYAQYLMSTACILTICKLDQYQISHPIFICKTKFLLGSKKLDFHIQKRGYSSHGRTLP